MTLEAKLNKLIELGWKPFDSPRAKRISRTGLAKSYIYTDGRQDEQIFTLNDLCSIDSGLWQFVCEKELYNLSGCKAGALSPIIHLARQVNDGERENFGFVHHQYRLMLSSIQEDKEKFLLDNILLPTNKYA